MFITTAHVGRVLTPNRSLSFLNAKSLSMASADFGAYSANTLSFSGYLYFNAIGASNQFIISKGTSFRIYRNSSYQIVVEYYGAGTRNYLTSNTYANNGVWYRYRIHLDAGNATSTDRIKLWIDGAADTGSGYSATKTTIDTNTDDIVLGGNNGGSYLDALMYQFAVYDNYLVAESDVYASSPKDIRGIAGLFSTIHTDDPNITDDYILSANWTNTGSVALSSSIPS